MLGAGVFAAFAPAADAAGAWLPAALALAAVVAWCNALSSARLAAIYPASGGTYVYGRERLGEFWGYLAGWSFVIGKTASCAAMAMTFAAYAFPQHARPAAVIAVLAVTALNYAGVQRSLAVTRVIVVLVIAVLLTVIVVTAGHGTPGALTPAGPFPAGGVLEAAGLLFFAFAGYARIATLGGEVRDPARSIPRAVYLSLGTVLILYAATSLAVLSVLGPDRLASATAPLAEATTAAGAPWLAPAVRVGAAVAALGALLVLILGVSRTSLAMATDRHLPRVLSDVKRAEIVVGVVVAVLVATIDLRGAIGFSSFGVLLYYAVANASAYTLGRRLVPVAGLAGCLILAFALPWTSVVAGLAVVLAGALIYGIRRRTSHAG